MTLKATQDRLLALAERHAARLSDLTSEIDSSADSLYRVLSQSAHPWLQLAHELARLVDTVRNQAHELAAAHALEELRAAIGKGADYVNLGLAPTPDPSDVSEYIAKAVQYTKETVAEIDDADAKREAFVASSFRAATIIESEATNAYRVARDTCNASIRKISDAEAKRLGFAIARIEEEFRNAACLTIRDDITWLPLIGERWSAAGSACEKCRAADGELRPFGFAFSLPGPTAHARCQCVRTFWVVPIPIEDRDVMADHETTASPESGLAWIHTTLDARAIDDATRTVRGAVASDETVDSHGSIIRAKGWNLARYQRNPVLIWNHATSRFGQTAQPEDVLGITTSDIKGKRLVSDLHFDDADVNPKADRVYRQIKKGTIRGLSVGFRPLKYHFEKQHEDDREEDELLIIDEAELAEISVVPIPSNPNTLAKELREFCMSKRALTTSVADNTAEESKTMTTENTTSQVVVLPAEIASKLGVDSIDKAVAEIAKRELQLDQATQERDALKTRCAELVAEIEKRDAAEAEAEVQALIDVKVLSADKKASALTLYKADREAFRSLYPKVTVAPLAHLLQKESVLKPENAKAAPPKSLADEVNPIAKRAEDILKAKPELKKDDALAMALNEYELGLLKSETNPAA